LIDARPGNLDFSLCLPNNST